MVICDANNFCRFEFFAMPISPHTVLNRNMQHATRKRNGKHTSNICTPMTMCFQLEDESTDKTELNRIVVPKKCRKMRKMEWLTDWTVSLVSLGIKVSEHKSTHHLQQSANHRHFQLPGIKCFPFLFPRLLCQFITILFAFSPICSIRANQWFSTRAVRRSWTKTSCRFSSLSLQSRSVVFTRSSTQ